MRRAWFRWCGVPSFIAAPCRRFVAVAEKAEKATVTIFDLTSTNLKKKRPLTCQECLSREYAPFAWALGSTANLMVSCHLGRQVRFACVLSRCKVFDGSRRWSRLDACHLDLGEEPTQGAPRHGISEHAVAAAATPSPSVHLLALVSAVQRT